MKLKALTKISEDIKWPTSSNNLPVLTWDERKSTSSARHSFGVFGADPFSAVQEASKTRDLVVISGFIHDVSTFIDEHPGSRGLIKTRFGKDATTAFYGR
jgi:stearoyl-CoA desaturase (Delta-9 desaturase)